MKIGHVTTDAELSELLNIPLLKNVAPVFYAACKKAGADGLTCRQMHMIDKTYSVLAYMAAAAALYDAGKIRHGWRTVPQPDTRAQESIYFYIAPDPVDEL